MATRRTVKSDPRPTYCKFPVNLNQTCIAKNVYRVILSQVHVRCSKHGINMRHTFVAVLTVLPALLMKKRVRYVYPTNDYRHIKPYDSSKNAPVDLTERIIAPDFIHISATYKTYVHDLIISSLSGRATIDFKKKKKKHQQINLRKTENETRTFGCDSANISRWSRLITVHFEFSNLLGAL